MSQLILNNKQLLETAKVPLTAILILVILTFIWNKYYTAYIKKEQAKAEQKQMERLEIFKYMKPSVTVPNIKCSILMVDNDSDISDALDYIKPPTYSKELLDAIHNGGIQ